MEEVSLPIMEFNKPNKNQRSYSDKELKNITSELLESASKRTYNFDNPQIDKIAVIEITLPEDIKL